jgi:membrane fusion protein (multidrug efflux system)
VSAAAVRDAQRKLSYTTITAPASGRVGNKSVEPGNYVLPGQILFAIAGTDVWVVANFKETQLARMTPGQEVEITIDALPKQVLHGKVDSISPASGAQFALLPPDNATGNFNKVVQRVPVKISFDEQSLRLVSDKIRLGLSAVVNVRVR